MYNAKYKIVILTIIRADKYMKRRDTYVFIVMDYAVKNKSNKIWIKMRYFLYFFVFIHVFVRYVILRKIR